MKHVFKGLLRVAVLSAWFSASAAVAVDVYIDTTVLNPVDDREYTEDAAFLIARDQLRSDLSAGLYDKLNIRMSIDGDDQSEVLEKLPGQQLSTENQGFYLTVTSAGFLALSSDLQNQILDNLMEYHTEAFVTNYRATVNPLTNRLSEVGFFGWLGIDTEGLTGIVPAERLLSTYARQWAYKLSLRNGPNCWHTAIASTNRSWSKHRYMNYYEFNCQLRRGYERLPATERLQYGDVVSLVDRSGVPVHGFVYLGPDSRTSGRHIVFTKNGYMRGSFLFQDYYTVVNYIYPGNVVQYFRPVRAAIDPADYTGTGCDSEYARDFESFLDERSLENPELMKPDPIIAAGLRTLSPENLPALRL